MQSFKTNELPVSPPAKLARQPSPSRLGFWQASSRDTKFPTQASHANFCRSDTTQASTQLAAEIEPIKLQMLRKGLPAAYPTNIASCNACFRQNAETPTASTKSLSVISIPTASLYKRPTEAVSPEVVNKLNNEKNPK